LSRRIQSGPVVVKRVDRIKDFTEFCDLFSVDRSREDWSVVPWVSVNNRYYREGMVVLLRTLNDDPPFGQIHTISISEDRSVKFLTKGLVARPFNEHYHAFKVEYEQCYHVAHEELLIELPCELRTGANGLLYVALRHAQF